MSLIGFYKRRNPYGYKNMKILPQMHLESSTGGISIIIASWFGLRLDKNLPKKRRGKVLNSIFMGQWIVQ